MGMCEGPYALPGEGMGVYEDDIVWQGTEQMRSSLTVKMFWACGLKNDIGDFV